MKVENLEVAKEEVSKELAALKKGIKKGYITKRKALTRELFAIYGHLKYGGKIVDLHKSMKKAGLLKTINAPRLAVIQGGTKWCYLHKKRNGGAIFSTERKDWHVYIKKDDVVLPADTFVWKNEDHLRTLAPIIPPRINVEISARIIPYHYYIIFETESWAKAPLPPRDPILATRLSKLLFGVLATWDLTELERNIILGRV